MNDTSFRNAKGQTQVLVVYKKSTLQTYEELQDIKVDNWIEQVNTFDPDKLKDAHLAHEACLSYVLKILHKHHFDVETCYRNELNTDITRDRMIITVGGDGTVLSASHFVHDNPIIGVNSNPAHSVGSLCAASVDNFETVLEDSVKNKTHWQKIVRVGGSVDDVPLPFLALNEILVAHSNPAATSRYHIQMNGHEEDQKSSGVWICTSAGSTGATSSAGGEVQPLDDDKLQFVVREPYFVETPVPSLLTGFIGPEQTLTIVSKMVYGQIYFDGPYRSYSFPLGSRLVVHSGVAPLWLYVLPEMEARRRRLGHFRKGTAC